MYQSENVMIVDDALKRIDSVLALKPLPDATKPKTLNNHSVEMREVSFSYNGEKNAINGVSLKINSGETVAFVGPSGSGKTTLASLIPRFFDPQSGRVLIGGEDVRNIPKEQLMDTVSFVFQDSCLIKTTVEENVRMGRPEATHVEVLQALSAAQCMDIIEKLPQGVSTIIGSQGTYLSGGEQQRIVIARAILKDAPIVLLDEATAFLDVENETLIQEALSRLIRGKTVMVIAHRMRTVAGVDKIVVLSDGVVSEQGPPAELRKRDGIFSRMASLQGTGR
jgi:ATP-binding cassette subfamily B protein